MPHPDDIEDPVGDYSDDKDPWKPLSPLEPGNLKIRPYRRVQGSSRVVNDTSKKKTLTILFPMAKMDGVIIPEHAKSFEAQPSQQEEHCSQSPPRFEKNALLASIAEVEKQSEMDARVSTWKEGIEDILEEQDKNPPFDIASYEEQVLGTLSSRTDNTGTASFSEIVSGRPKYEVARTFFALLQLVNDKNVDLEKGQTTNESVCYTAENPFHVRLISPNRRPEMEAQMEARFARKRVKSPLRNAGQGGESSLAQHECPQEAVA